MILTVVISGVEIVAVFVLALVAVLLVSVVLEQRRRALDQQTQFLEGLRRMTARVRRQYGRQNLGQHP